MTWPRLCGLVIAAAALLTALLALDTETAIAWAVGIAGATTGALMALRHRLRASRPDPVPAADGLDTGEALPDGRAAGAILPGSRAGSGARPAIGPS